MQAANSSITGQGTKTSHMCDQKKNNKVKYTPDIANLVQEKYVKHSIIFIFPIGGSDSICNMFSYIKYIIKTNFTCFLVPLLMWLLEHLKLHRCLCYISTGQRWSG